MRFSEAWTEERNAQPVARLKDEEGEEDPSLLEMEEEEEEKKLRGLEA